MPNVSKSLIATEFASIDDGRYDRTLGTAPGGVCKISQMTHEKMGSFIKRKGV